MKFPWKYWYYTGAEERLGELSKEDLYVFKLLVDGAP